MIASSSSVVDQLFIVAAEHPSTREGVHHFALSLLSLPPIGRQHPWRHSSSTKCKAQRNYTLPSLCQSRHHLACIFQQPSYFFSLLSSLPSPHPLPMAGCCVLGRRGRTLSMSSLPLDHPVAIITLTPIVC